MSHDDPYRSDPGRDRGAYTPPNDDDLPFNRGFDARRPAPRKAPPVTLLISGAVLLALIVAVLVMQPWRQLDNGAPPAVGEPVTSMRVEAVEEAQPVNPEEGVRGVYPGGAEPAETAPTFTAPPEAVQPRPAPRPETAPPVPAPTTAAPRPTPTPPAPTPAAPPRPAPTTTGASSVQIGAYSTPAMAEQQYAEYAGRYSQFTSGAGQRIQEVTASNGSTVYRTIFTGMSRERADAFCAAIQARGQTCIVR